MAKPKAKKTKRELEAILPEDLLFEILLRLPLKSLVQCKLLSSLWNTQISARNLTLMRLERCPYPDSTLLLKSRIFHLTILPRHNGDINSICRAKPRHAQVDMTDFKVVGTQHGLICFADDETGDVWVWNPVMDQWRRLDFQRASYNPSSNTLFGFGYDTNNDDYKAIRISNGTRLEANCVTVEICGLRNTETRVLVKPSALVKFVLGNAMPVTINGSSYWMAFHRENQDLHIVRFDMDEEKFVEIPLSNNMPNIFRANGRGIIRSDINQRALEGFDIDGKRFRMGVYRESLCLFITDSLKVDIWLMNRKNRDESHVVWTKMFKIPIRPWIKEVVGFTANEELVIRDNNNAYSTYDPWRKRSVVPLGCNLMIQEVLAYVETPVSVLQHY